MGCDLIMSVGALPQEHRQLPGDNKLKEFVDRSGYKPRTR
jgi:hypothetical protein